MKTFPQDDGLGGVGTGLVLAMVMILFTLLSDRSQATPQTHDADLKTLQVPAIVWAHPANFQGLRTKLAGDVSAIDLRNFSGGIASLDLSEVTSVASGEYDFDGIGKVTGLGSFLALLPASDLTLQMTNCGLTDASAFIAIYNLGSGSNNVVSIQNNPINGPVGNIGQVGGGTCYLTLSSCGITSVGTLGDLTGSLLQLSGNAITSLDLSTGACSLDNAYLVVSDNPLTTLVPGDGTTTGIVTANGGSIYFDNCALSTAQVNGLLVALAAMAVNTGSVGTLNLASGSNGAPSGAGADAVDALVSMGWSLTTN